MTVILPIDHRSRQILQENGISCVTQDEAQKQDIRPLRIGILNIMPNIEGYEFNLLLPLGRTLIQIEPVWIRLSRASHTTDHDKIDYLSRNYVTYEEANQPKKLDGLIVTGAAVGRIPFEDVRYWDEISEIFDHARNNLVSTLGICWGGIAMAYHLDHDLKREFYDHKLFGIYRGQNLNRKHPITGNLDDEFDCPQSRYSRISDRILEEKAGEGLLNLLAFNEDAGYFIFETPDHRFVMHLGHPEYNRHRLMDEWERDQKAGLKDVPHPHRFDFENPKNTWRSHRNEFFSAWIKYLYLENEF